MDANKLKQLQEIGYSIQPSCGLCKAFSGDVRTSDGFGTCSIYTYEHLKHTGPPRQLSVHCFGTCSKFTCDAARLGKLHGFTQLLKA